MDSIEQTDIPSALDSTSLAGGIILNNDYDYLSKFKSVIPIFLDNNLKLYIVHDKYDIRDLNIIEIDNKKIIDSYYLMDGESTIAFYKYIDENKSEFLFMEHLNVKEAFLFKLNS